MNINELFDNEEILENFINQFVKPELLSISQEYAQPIQFKTTIKYENSINSSEVIINPDYEGNVVEGEVKILITKGYSTSSLRFSVKCILNGFIPDMNFSGFSFDGKLIIENEITIKIKPFYAITYLYGPHQSIRF